MLGCRVVALGDGMWSARLLLIRSLAPYWRQRPLPMPRPFEDSCEPIATGVLQGGSRKWRCLDFVEFFRRAWVSEGFVDDFCIPPRAGSQKEANLWRKNRKLDGMASRPSWARGLKLGNKWVALAIASASRPSWARGLKRIPANGSRQTRSSRPSWARGLKPAMHSSRRVRRSLVQVAPFVGAWIETLIGQRSYSMYLIESRPSWARGLKPPRFDPARQTAPVAPFVGAWIETLWSRARSGCAAGRALRGRVD
jgi:hypothetical protein